MRPAPSSPATRRSMQSNRRADTKPELALRSELHGRGLRYRKDFPLSLGDGRRTRADIVFPRARVVVFVDGCFWHGCPTHGESPKSNADYWTPKIAANRQRDLYVTAALEALDWTVLRVWEHESVGDAADRVEYAVRRTPRPPLSGPDRGDAGPTP